MSYLLPARKIPCPHCKGSGEVAVPADIETIEAYYFGCWERSGHFWHSNKYTRERDIEARVGPGIADRIDSGFCPGKIPGEAYSRSRVEFEGEASLHHVDGWTILALWDRSIDHRGGCNSNFVVRGTHTYAVMCAIAEAQFPSVWHRFKFEIRLVEEA
jgi:hypothetical protein